jgi:hypothetical protein
MISESYICVVSANLTYIMELIVLNVFLRLIYQKLIFLQENFLELKPTETAID